MKAARTSLRKTFRREGVEGFALYAPALAIIFFIVIYPILYALYLSTWYYHLVRLADRRFVGLGNYALILSDPAFWMSLVKGMIFTFGSLIPQLVLGLALAQLLNHPRLKWKTLWRGLAITPWLVPTVTVALIYRWMFHDIYGIVNHILLGLRLIPRPIAWLADENLAMVVLIIANVWRGLPLMITMFLAGLQGIPNELYQAAVVDGAGGWQSYFRITLPLLAPVILIAGILRTIWMFNFYDLPWVMTRGGPASATATPPIYAYLRAFSGYRLGEGGAITVLLLLVLMVFAVVYFWLRKRSLT